MEVWAALGAIATVVIAASAVAQLRLSRRERRVAGAPRSRGRHRQNARAADGAALGRRVRAKRAAMHMSQEELATRAGLHRTYVGGIERGERNPSVTNVARLAEALGTTPGDLLERREHGLDD